MYWSGTSPTRDADGWIYLAGRTGSGCGSTVARTCPAPPIERILHRLHPINRVAVRRPPDDLVGDAVMAAIVLRDGASLSPGEFTGLPVSPGGPVAQSLAPVAWIADDLPVTATNKVIMPPHRPGRPHFPTILWERAPRSRSYRA